jgi:predicted DNA-binding transcriptional regulator AlpA
MSNVFNDEPQTIDRLLDVRAVGELLGGTRPLNPATIYRAVAANTLPPPLKIGRASRWLESEINEVIRQRAVARR